MILILISVALSFSLYWNKFRKDKEEEDEGIILPAGLENEGDMEMALLDQNVACTQALLN
jgi:hypothetical protein